MYGTTGGARGQPVQIGVLLVFAFLIIGLALFQAVLIPQENSQVEFNHNQDLQSDMVDLRSDLLRSAATGEARTTRVRLGTTYPSRTLLLNPAPPGGTLRSGYRGNLSITNAQATSTTGVEDFWDGDTTDDPTWTTATGDPVPSRHTFRTNALLYEPSYNVYDGAPETVFEGSVLYNRFPDETLALSNQTLISGRTISLTAVQGEYQQSTSGAVSVDPRIVSATNRTVTVTDSDGPVTLRVPTRLSLSRWETLLSGEMGTGSDQHVTDLSMEEGPGETDILVVTLEEGVSYNLKLGAVAVGSRGPTEGTEHDPQYLVVTGGSGGSIDEGDTRQLTVEVRDRYNNPVSGATVTVGQPTVGYLVGGEGDPLTLTTDANGRATVTYAAPRNVRRNQDAAFTASIPGGGDARTVELGVTVEDDSEAAVNGDYQRPLLTAIEPTPDEGGNSADEPFVRAYFPPGSASNYVLETGGGERSVPEDPEGTYYFVGGDNSLDGPCDGVDATTVDLGTATLDRSAGTVTLRNTDTGLVRDSLTYDGDRSNDNSGGPVTFTDAQVGVRVTEDGGFVDSNVSAVDWASDRASEVCDVDQPPTVGALSASSNLASIVRDMGTIEAYTDRVTFTFNTSDDRDTPTVTVEAAPSDGTPSESTTASDPAGSVTLVFDSDVEMSGNNDGFIDITVTVSDGSAETDDRVCTGRLDDAGQTLTREDLSCSVGSPP